MPPCSGLRPAAVLVGRPARAFSSSSSMPPEPPTRWLADLPARTGKCLMFGCTPAQTRSAASVLRALATEWRGLAAGSEGFLTGGRRGLEGQQVVWGEMDSFGHVNNVTYARYAESARVNWITNFAVQADSARRKQWAELMTPRGVGLIIKSLQTDFKFPMTYPDTISAYHKLRESPIGQSQLTSLVLDCVILSHRHRRPAARTREDIAIYDYKIGRTTEMPAFMRDVLSDVWRLQQGETLRARTRIWELVRAVESLEKETWDREGAVEDLGSVNGKA